MEIIEFPIQNASDTQRQLEQLLLLLLLFFLFSLSKVGAGVEVRSASVVCRLSLKLTLARGLRGLCRLPPIALTTTIRFGCGRRSISLPLPLLFSFRLSLFPFSRSPLPSSHSFLFLLLNKFSVIYV